MVVTRVLDAYVLIKILRTVVHCDTTVIAIFVTNECLPWPFPTHEISVYQIGTSACNSLFSRTEAWHDRVEKCANIVMECNQKM